MKSLDYAVMYPGRTT